MTQPLEFSYLADRPDAIQTIGQWYFERWGYLLDGETPASSVDRLQSFLNRDKIPFVLVATCQGTVVGAAQLKYREMADLFPSYEHWLGGVYVAREHRGQGFGSQIAEQIATVAPGCGVETLYLQTEAMDGGLYAPLGWQPVTQVAHHGLQVLVMARPVPRHQDETGEKVPGLFSDRDTFSTDER